MLAFTLLQSLIFGDLENFPIESCSYFIALNKNGNIIICISMELIVAEDHATIYLLSIFESQNKLMFICWWNDFIDVYIENDWHRAKCGQRLLRKHMNRVCLMPLWRKMWLRLAETNTVNFNWTGNFSYREQRFRVLILSANEMD